jgi:hypothetical protein
MQDEKGKIKEELSPPPSSVRGSANWTGRTGQGLKETSKGKDYHTQ